jgi:glycosyltransferase involved in cell wall biosynthesis
MVIAERVTSYGFLAATTGFKKIAIAQQGITDIFPPNSISVPIKKLMQYYAFKKATLIHAWGKAMTISMFKTSVQKEKILVLPKGVKIDKFNFNIEEKNWDKIHAIVTRSLFPEYRHETIIKAFKLVDNAGIDFELVIVGGGELEKKLKDLAQKLNISSKIVFSGRIPNEELPDYLNKSNLYLSMPITEGVSSSLFEAMACGCYPIVSNIIGNRSWIENDINGNLVDIDNIESLAEKIINYWKNKENSIPAIIKNRKFVEENASLEKNMKIISKLYHQIIG